MNHMLVVGFRFCGVGATKVIFVCNVSAGHLSEVKSARS